MQNVDDLVHIRSTMPSASCSQSHVDNVRVNAATLNLSLPLYLLKLNIENE